MTRTASNLSDDLIRRALADLAAGPDAYDLVAAVVRETEITAQARRSTWRAAARPRAALVLIAAALLLAALAGAVAVGSGLLRLPAQVQRTTIFHRPFQYMPMAELQFMEPWDVVGMSRTSDVAMVRSMLGPGSDDEVIKRWDAELKGRLIGFTVSGRSGDRGVIVALPGDEPFGGAIWCFGPGNGWSDPPTAEEVLRGYREWTTGLTIPSPRPTAFDGYPASSLRTPAGRCPTLKPTERTHVTREAPGILTLLDVDGATLAVVIWGKTDATLDEWLPTATQFVHTIHFVTEEST